MPALVGVHTWVSADFPHFSSLLLHLLYFSCHSFASLGFVGTFWCIMGLLWRWAKSSKCSCALHFLSLTVWPHFYPLHWHSKEVSHSTPAYRFNRTRVDCIAISSNVNTPTRREEANCKDPGTKDPESRFIRPSPSLQKQYAIEKKRLLAEAVYRFVLRVGQDALGYSFYENHSCKGRAFGWPVCQNHSQFCK